MLALLVNLTNNPTETTMQPETNKPTLSAPALKKLYRVIQEESNKVKGEISPEMNCVSDLGLDSLDMVELIMAVEDEFDIVISDSELPPDLRTVTVGFFIDSIAPLIAEKNPALSHAHITY